MSFLSSPRSPAPSSSYPSPSYASNRSSVPSMDSDAISIATTSSSSSSSPVMEFWNEGFTDPDLYWFNDDYNQQQNYHQSNLYPMQHQHNNNDQSSFANDGIPVSASAPLSSSNWGIPNFYTSTPMPLDDNNTNMRVDSHHMIEVNNRNIDDNNDHNKNPLSIPPTIPPSYNTTNATQYQQEQQQSRVPGVGSTNSFPPPPPPHDRRQPSTSSISTSSKHNRNKRSHRSSTSPAATAISERGPISTPASSLMSLDNSHPGNTTMTPKAFFDLLNPLTKSLITYLKDFEVFQSQHSTPCYLLNHVLCHTAFDQNKCKEVLLEIGYSLRTNNNETNIVDENIYTNNTDYTELWRHPHPDFPYITFPYNSCISWSSSPDTCIEEPDNVLSFATLTWIRSPLLTFYKQQLPASSSSTASTAAYKIIAVDSRSTSSIDLTTHTPIPASQVNLSHVELPSRVEVNRAFERLFGYSQSEVKHIFMREDNRGILKLMDPDSVRRVIEYDTAGLATGQTDSAQYVNIWTKYSGPHKLRALLCTKRVIMGLALERKIYTWVPLPVEPQPPIGTSTVGGVLGGFGMGGAENKSSTNNTSPGTNAHTIDAPNAATTITNNHNIDNTTSAISHLANHPKKHKK